MVRSTHHLWREFPHEPSAVDILFDGRFVAYIEEYWGPFLPIFAVDAVALVVSCGAMMLRNPRGEMVQSLVEEPPRAVASAGSGLANGLPNNW